MTLKKLALACALLLATDASAIPRGVRQNNPGNIRCNYVFEFKAWPNAMGVDDEHYLTFKRPIDGVRAIVINLKGYSRKHKICTPRGIVTRWTYREASPRVLKDYTTVMCRSIGMNIKPDTRLNMEDPRVIQAVTWAIIYYENGYDPYTKALYDRVFPRRK